MDSGQRRNPWNDGDWKSWAEFLGAWVDYRHGSGISDKAWDAYTLTDGGPHDGE